jgi:hypothetical protein
MEWTTLGSGNLGIAEFESLRRIRVPGNLVTCYVIEGNE